MSRARPRSKLLPLVLAFFCGASGARADGPGATDSENPVQVSTAWSATGVHPGEAITLAVILDIRPPLHVTPHHPEDPTLIPTTLEIIDPPPELRVSTPVYPRPGHVRFGPVGAQSDVPAYQGRTIIFVPMAATPRATPQKLSLHLRVGWQACNDAQCFFPENRDLDLSLSVVDPAGTVTPTHEEIFAGAPGGPEAGATSRLEIPFFGLDFSIDPTSLWLLLLIAMAGGFLLNLTPCVLPLIPIKIMGLSRAAGHPTRAFLLGTVMAAGVVAFWMLLGGLIATVTGFTAANQLFQYPVFTIAVGAIVGLMAFGMSGMFTVRLPAALSSIQPSHDTLHGSFLFGVMTAVLSTPCTAPFMGAAAAWAATRSAPVTLVTFAAIGFGMALPYIVLARFPRLVSRMPKSGPASELVKQVMGLLMLAAAVYFIGTGASGLLDTPPDPPSRAYWWAVGACIAAAGAWLGWGTFRITHAGVKRAVFGGLGVLFIVASIVIATSFAARGPVNWIYYTPKRLAQARSEGRAVVLEFTAEWCLNCKALEQAVLSRADVARALNAPDVAPIKVDITGNNVAGSEKLLEVGSRTIPLLIVYGRDGSEIFRSDAYTAGQLLDALRRARATKAEQGDRRAG